MSVFLLCTQRDAHDDPRQMKKKLISSTAVSSLNTSIQRLYSSARGSSQRPPEIVLAVHGREPACCFCHTKLSLPPHHQSPTPLLQPILTDCLNIKPCRSWPSLLSTPCGHNRNNRDFFWSWMIPYFWHEPLMQHKSCRLMLTTDQAAIHNE